MPSGGEKDLEWIVEHARCPARCGTGFPRRALWPGQELHAEGEESEVRQLGEEHGASKE